MAGWALLGAGTVFTGMLLLSPLGVPDRYLLVPAVSLHALAGLAIAMLVEIVARGRAESWPTRWVRVTIGAFQIQRFL